MLEVNEEAGNCSTKSSLLENWNPKKRTKMLLTCEPLALQLTKVNHSQGLLNDGGGQILTVTPANPKQERPVLPSTLEGCFGCAVTKLSGVRTRKLFNMAVEKRLWEDSSPLRRAP